MLKSSEIQTTDTLLAQDEGDDIRMLEEALVSDDAEILREKVAAFVKLHTKTKNLIQAQIKQLEDRSLKRERVEQQRYRDLVDGINHGFVWTADPVTLAPVFVSHSSETILGHSLQASLTDPTFLFSHIHPEDQESFLTALRTLILTEQDIELDHRYIRSNGDTLWFHTGLQLSERDENGAKEIRGLSVDITAVKEAHETIRRAHARSDLLSEGSRLLSESLDSEMTFAKLVESLVPRFADLMYIEIYSENSRRIVEAGKATKALEPELSALRHALNDGKILLTGETKFDPEAPIITTPLFIRGNCRGTVSLGLASKKERYSKNDLSMLEDLARRIATAADNTNLYAQAREAIRTRDEFLSIASHELKTPLTPLKLQTQALIRTLKNGSLASINPDRLKKMLDTSDRQIERLARLIDELLDISRISSGKLEISLIEFDLVELIHEVFERFSEQISGAGSSLELNLPKSLIVNLDPFRIEQVLINLLTNAIKYGEGKKIELHCHKVNEEVLIYFRDHGIGIPLEDQSRVFDRFERAVSSSHFGGLGLGLYIVSQILESHQGKITLQSEPGKGSTFKVTLPLNPIRTDLPAEEEFSFDHRASLEAEETIG